MAATSDGFLLGGRVPYRQFVEGYRTGIEPVLLAAAVPALPGELVLELGTGAGAGLLCLLARVPGCRGHGVELDPALAELARHNLRHKGHAALVEAADIATVATRAEHGFANPPWFDPADTPSPDAARRLARRLTAAGLRPWVAALARSVKGRGTITLALPAGLIGTGLGLLAECGWGRAGVMPLWPRAGREAKLALLQARRGSGSTRLLPGLTLHEGRGYTVEAEAVLRGGGPLPFNEPAFVPVKAVEV